MITYFEIKMEYQEIYFLGKFYGRAKISDVELYIAGQLSDNELLARCIDKLPRHINIFQSMMDNYQNN